MIDKKQEILYMQYLLTFTKYHFSTVNDRENIFLYVSNTILDLHQIFYLQTWNNL